MDGKKEYWQRLGRNEWNPVRLLTIRRFILDCTQATAAVAAGGLYVAGEYDSKALGIRYVDG